MTAVVLRDDAWNVRVQPRFGGSLAACEFRGQPILAPVREPNPWPGIELCYYPLVPFANRIGSSRFSFDGREIRLEPNLAGYPHAIHGQGWQAEWQLVDAAPTACAIAFEHTASGRWPWDYNATQTFEIAESSLKIRLALQNGSATRMPAGLGFHPFFARPDSALLTASAAGLWSGDAAQFPRLMSGVPPALDFAHCRPIRDARGLDRCYSGWRRRAQIEWPDAPYRVSIVADEPLAHLMLYVPVDRNFFCVEPVSHVVDAVNFARDDPHGMIELEPGQELSVSMTLSAVSSVT
jgi:aldose 1-epimerase